MEVSSAENEILVRRICEQVTAARAAGMPVQPQDQIIFDIDYLLMEVNSGASFEQYFQWVPIADLQRIVPALDAAALGDIAELVQRAMAIAFPEGIPVSEEKKLELPDFSEEQREKLRALFPSFESENGRITNALAAFATKS